MSEAEIRAELLARVCWTGLCVSAALKTYLRMLRKQAEAIAALETHYAAAEAAEEAAGEQAPASEEANTPPGRILVGEKISEWRKAHRAEMTERNSRIVAAYKNGATLAQAGAPEGGLSAARVHQIIKDHERATGEKIAR